MSWKKQFAIQKEWEKKKTIRIDISEIIFHQSQASFHKSEINGNLVEYHFYDMVAKAAKGEEDAVVKSMPQNQSILLERNKSKQAHHELAVSEYEKRIHVLDDFVESDCPNEVKALARAHFSETLDFQMIIAKAVIEHPSTSAKPHEILAYLKKNAFRNFIDFGEERRLFKNAVNSCFGALIK